MLLTFILGVVFGIKADEHGWTVNPYDYQYDMTAYISLKIDGQEVSDLSNFEIAAFCGDQCRGVVEVKSAGGHQYGYLRIRSNQAQGETISFRIYNKVNEKNVRSDNELTFKSDASMGYPSAPFVIEGVNRYEVAFVVDDTKTVTYQYYGDKLEVPADPVKEGYKFTGWLPVLEETVPAHNLIYTATFEVMYFTVSFFIDNELYERRKFDYGTEILPPEMPEKTGYTFAGWQPFPKVMPAEDINVYGSYDINSYKLTYIVDGLKYKEIDVEYKAAIVPEEYPAKEGYTFSGWNDLPEVMPAENVTATGEFLINSYKLTFMIGEEVVCEVVYEYNANVYPAVPPEKEGYSFAGWENLPERMPAQDLIIRGAYSVNSYKLIYMLDGEIYKELAVDYDSVIVPETAPEREGYSFSGWEGLPEIMPAEDVTVTATFSINSYTLTIYLNGKKYMSADLEYGSDIDEFISENMNLPGNWIFTGWVGDIPATMPAYDLDIYGTYSGSSAVDSLFKGDEKVTVFTLSGILMYKDADAEEVFGNLASGYYIVNGKKYLHR